MKKINNTEVNKRLKKIFFDKGITYCEVNLSGCTRTFGLTFAHLHKRRWYYGKQELLYDFNQVLLSCIQCHIKIEKDAKLTIEIFNKLRKHEK